MRKLLSIFVLAAVAFAAQAVDVTVFDGTDQNQYIPFRATYFDWSPYYGEVIYPAAEITDLLGKDITSVKFYVANANGNAMNGGELSLYLGTTTQADFSAWSVSLIPASELTLVSATPMTYGDTEIVFNLDEPFTYNGDNLVLMLSVTVEGSYRADGYFYGQNVSVKGSAYGATSVTAQTFYPKTTFTYGGEEPQTNIATTLAQANAMEDNAEFTFNGDAVVTVCWKGSVYLRDESGYGQIVDGATFENGDVLSQGWTATKTSDNGWVKFTDAEGLIASGETNAELAAAQVLTAFPDESMLNAYVVIENVQKSFVPIRAITLPDGSTISLTGTGNQGATGTYNIYGLIWKASDGSLVFEPVKWQKIVVPTWELGDVNHDHAVNVADVTDLVKYILTSGSEPEVFYPEQANVDGIEPINVADVTALIQKILQN